MTAKDLSPQILQILSLVRLKTDCKITPTRVDFTPLNKPNATPISILPRFNQDKAFFTPSFIIESEKKYFKDNSTFEKHQFEEKIQRSVQVISTLIPSQAAQNLLLPSPNTNYCQICRENFDNYFTHISLKLHRLRCTNTEMTPIINELCQDFAQRQARTNTKEKTKLIQKGRKQERHLIQKAEKKQAKYLKVGKGPSVKRLTEGSSTKQSATSQSNK